MQKAAAILKARYSPTSKAVDTTYLTFNIPHTLEQDMYKKRVKQLIQHLTCMVNIVKC